MSTKAELQALLERVKAATGPNYALEIDIHALFARAVDTPDRRAPAYTASLDAITALIERELPGRGYGVLPAFDAWGGWIFRTMSPARFGGGHDIGKGGPTPALALTAAFLSALIAQMEPSHAE